MQQLTETIDLVRDNYRGLLKSGFTRFSTKYARSFTEPESGYVVGCTVELSKTKRGYSLGSVSMEWPKNPLVLNYIPLASLLDIIELVNKLYGTNKIQFTETDGVLKKFTLDVFKTIDSQPEKISSLNFSSKKIVQPSRKIHVRYGHKRDHEPKVSFSYDGNETEFTKKLNRDFRKRHRIIADSENETPSWSAYLRVKTPKNQDLELITQIFDITVKSVKS